MLRRILPATIGLMMGLLILAVFAPSFSAYRTPSRIVAAQVQVHNFLRALDAYKRDTGAFPSNDQGLRALRVAPTGMTNWAGPYMPQDIPRDPWGHDYVYKYPGDHGDEPDIICYGADGEAGGEGLNADIVSWKN